MVYGVQMLSQSLAASNLSRGAGSGAGSGLGSSYQHRDPALTNWLTDLNIDQQAVDKFSSEDLTLNDVLDLMSRDDLKRLGLKAGPELRIWREILRHRNLPTTPTS